METLVNQIQGLSSKDSDLEQLKKTLESKLELISKSINIIPNVLSALDANTHTLGCVYLLYVKLSFPQVEPHFLPAVEMFLANFDGKQARMAGEKFAVVIHRYTQLCLELRHPMRGIRPLSAALRRVQPAPEHFTCVHSDLMLLCLLSKNYKAALTQTHALTQPLFVVPPRKTGLAEPRDLLLFYYYGSMIYIGLKNFKKALDLLEAAITMPAHALNAIVVESLKKYILVSVLVSGKYTGVPQSSVPQSISRHFKTFASEYIEFSTAYATRDITKVTEVASQHAEVFQKDKNFGLVKQCVKSLFRLNIQRLTQTYLTLSLPDIAQTAKLSNAREAEIYILKMIEAGEVNASISQVEGNGMVSFTESSESGKFASASTTETLENRISRTMKLIQAIKQYDDEIGASHEYLTKISGGDRMTRDEMMMDEFGDRPGMMGRVGARFGNMARGLVDNFFKS